MKQFYLTTFALLWALQSNAQAWTDSDKKTAWKPGKGIEYKVEMQASAAKDQTPLWLNANKHGLSSLDDFNGYVRAGVLRPVSNDSARRWAVGYGLDVVLPMHYTSKAIVQQAFTELRWLHGSLTVGSKEIPMELKNNRLSTGSQTLGINARPVPQVRLALPDYWRLPFGNGWLHLKGHMAFGMQTDDNWQKTFTSMQSKYTEKVLYHSKAGYLKIGNDDVFAPLSLELGLEMATLFGGTSYRFDTTDPAKVARGGTGLKHFLHAFVPGGYEVSEADIVYKNVEGNHLGSWLMRANYNSDTWRFSVYMDKFFEDHSAMLQLDYDGYGEGDKWNTRTKSRYLLYDFKDMLFGAELNFKYGSWLRNILFEYVYTKYQSGPIYHDRTRNLPDHVAGVDEFYNHLIYTGWQHWGQVMGNPLFLSPQYNKDGVIDIRDNRFVAYHLGLEGTPFDNLDYRFMATYRRGYGTYHTPYNKPKESFHMMLESTYRFKHGWTVSGALAMDFGRWLKRQAGVQLTVSKKGIFNL